MSPIEALKILDAATQTIALPRREHLLIIEALNTLQALVKAESSTQPSQPNYSPFPPN